MKIKKKKIKNQSIITLYVESQPFVKGIMFYRLSKINSANENNNIVKLQLYQWTINSYINGPLSLYLTQGTLLMNLKSKYWLFHFMIVRHKEEYLQQWYHCDHEDDLHIMNQQYKIKCPRRLFFYLQSQGSKESNGNLTQHQTATAYWNEQIKKTVLKLMFKRDDLSQDVILWDISVLFS